MPNDHTPIENHTPEHKAKAITGWDWQREGDMFVTTLSLEDAAAFATLLQHHFHDIPHFINLHQMGYSIRREGTSPTFSLPERLFKDAKFWKPLESNFHTALEDIKNTVLKRDAQTPSKHAAATPVGEDEFENKRLSLSAKNVIQFINDVLAPKDSRELDTPAEPVEGLTKVIATGSLQQGMHVTLKFRNEGDAEACNASLEFYFQQEGVLDKKSKTLTLSPEQLDMMHESIQEYKELEPKANKVLSVLRNVPPPDGLVFPLRYELGGGMPSIAAAIVGENSAKTFMQELRKYTGVMPDSVGPDTDDEMVHIFYDPQQIETLYAKEELFAKEADATEAKFKNRVHKPGAGRPAEQRAKIFVINGSKPDTSPSR